MTTRCETIMQAIVTALRVDNGDAVTRGRSVQLATDETTSIDVSEVSDEIIRIVNEKTEHALTVEIRVFVRAAEPRERADMLRGDIHRRLYSDATFTAVRQALVEAGCEWDNELGVPDAALLRMRYRLPYYCNRTDLDTN